LLKRLSVGETRRIFLIVDRAPAHRAKTSREFERIVAPGGTIPVLLPV
jgi:hypothetical protein